MAKKESENEGKVFVGMLFLGAGVGYIVSIETENWMYMGACTLIGMGLGFVLMPFVRTK